jgi:hypothetical protein
MLNVRHEISFKMPGTVACSEVGERDETKLPGVPELILEV